MDFLICPLSKMNLITMLTGHDVLMEIHSGFDWGISAAYKL
jgi:hypothetical protein